MARTASYWPGHSSRSPRPPAEQDPAINDGYQVGVSGQVEQGTGPGTVDAAEQHVAIQGGGQAGGVGDRQLQSLDPGVRSGRGAPQGPGQHLDFGARQAGIAGLA